MTMPGVPEGLIAAGDGEQYRRRKDGRTENRCHGGECWPVRGEIADGRSEHGKTRSGDHRAGHTCGIDGDSAGAGGQGNAHDGDTHAGPPAGPQRRSAAGPIEQTGDDWTGADSHDRRSRDARQADRDKEPELKHEECQGSRQRHPPSRRVPPGGVATRRTEPDEDRCAEYDPPPGGRHRRQTRGQSLDGNTRCPEQHGRDRDLRLVDVDR